MKASGAAFCLLLAGIIGAKTTRTGIVGYWNGLPYHSATEIVSNGGDAVVSNVTLLRAETPSNIEYGTSPQAKIKNIVVTRDVTEDLGKNTAGTYISGPGSASMGEGVGGYISLHDQIHKAKDAVLKATSDRLQAALKAQELKLTQKAIEAERKKNLAEMLKEEEEELAARKMVDPDVFVKDTVPIAQVSHNGVTFNHHNELLADKLKMIDGYQKKVLEKARTVARLHKARLDHEGDPVDEEVALLFKEFAANGPAENLVLEIPVDAGRGRFYVAKDGSKGYLHPGRVRQKPTTTNDLPYYLVHRKESGQGHAFSYQYPPGYGGAAVQYHTYSNPYDNECF
jgi:hypothetical protein